MTVAVHYVGLDFDIGYCVLTLVYFIRRVMGSTSVLCITWD